MTVAGASSARSPLQKRTWRYPTPPSTLLLNLKVGMLPQGYGIWLKRQPVLGFREMTGPPPGEEKRFFPEGGSPVF